MHLLGFIWLVYGEGDMLEPVWLVFSEGDTLGSTLHHSMTKHVRILLGIRMTSASTGIVSEMSVK